jgi:hypothetical protein
MIVIDTLIKEQSLSKLLPATHFFRVISILGNILNNYCNTPTNRNYKPVKLNKEILIADICENVHNLGTI